MQDKVSSGTVALGILTVTVNKSFCSKTDSYLHNVWVLFEFFATGSIVGHFYLHTPADVPDAGLSFPPRKYRNASELYQRHYLYMHTHWLSNHNHFSCSTCLDCFSEGVRFTRCRSLAQLRAVIQIRCSRLGQLWVTHWNTLETCSHFVWVPTDSIMGGSMDG